MNLGQNVCIVLKTILCFGCLMNFVGYCLGVSIQTMEFQSSDSTTEDANANLPNPWNQILVHIRKRTTRYWEPWELNLNICPPSLCTSSDSGSSRPRGTAGTVFYNGDIVLDSEMERIIYGKTKYRYKRATVRSKSRIWKRGIVPYTFADDISPLAKKFIRMAMSHIEGHTCIRFIKKKPKDKDYIRFISEPGCWSNIGRLGGEQRVSLGRGCEQLGVAIHEITHALGFWHEQARPDRDKFIKVLKENVSPRYLPDFEIVARNLTTGRGYPYDYESVMHYSSKAFTNTGEDTIEVIGIGKKLKLEIGQRMGLSTHDIAQLRDIYGCTDREDFRQMQCPKGWQKHERSCYKFIDRKQYQFAAAHKYCEQYKAKLVFIDTAQEDEFFRDQLLKKYTKERTWRIGGKIENGTFGWFIANGKKMQDMKYTNWKKGHPSSFSSLILVVNHTSKEYGWEGAWVGSKSQLPNHTYPFICERRASRKCIPGIYRDGRLYRGNMNHTIDGITCQKWSSQYPHSHKLLPYPYKNTGVPEPDGLGDHNFCRNPTGMRRSRPWCFTAKFNYEWQYCDITICSGNGQNVNYPSMKKENNGQNVNYPSMKKENNVQNVNYPSMKKVNNGQNVNYPSMKKENNGQNIRGKTFQENQQSDRLKRN